MKIRNFAVLAFATMALFACNNDNYEGADDGSALKGEETWAAFTIKLPKTVGIRATAPETTATTNENLVKNVVVYVGDVATGFIQSSGIKLLADYGSQTGTTVATDKVAIKTTAGAKRIWVLLNATQAMHNQIMRSTGLAGFQEAYTAAVTDMTGGYQYSSETVADAKGFLMSNEAVEETLVANIKENDALNGGTASNAKNHFVIKVERAVAKVAVMAKDGGIDNQLPLIGTFSDAKYSICQINPKTYLARWTDTNVQPKGAGIVTPVNTHDGLLNPAGTFWGNTAMKTAPLTIQDKATTATEGIYVLENSMINPYQQNATYALIQVKWTPVAGQLHNADGTQGGTLNANGDFWYYQNKYYVAAPTAAGVDADKYKWANGICYYRIYLYDKYNTNTPDATGTKFYDVVRNTYYAVTVNSMMAPGSNVPTPPDPDVENPTDPKPNPIEEDTHVSVNVGIKVWATSSMDDVDLQ